MTENVVVEDRRALAAEDKLTCSTDVNEVECPWCGAANAWQDLLTDNCLVAGRTEPCDECGKPIEIAAVDWEPTIWTKRGNE